MNLKEFKKQIKDVDDSAVLCIPDLIAGEDGEVANLEVSYLTTPHGIYVDIDGNKIYNEDLVILW